MQKRILSSDIMKYIALFQAITRTDVKDCFLLDDSSLMFIVEQGQIGKALGKKASNVKRIENKLNKKLRVVEYKPEVKNFIKSLLFPLKVADISGEEGVVEITPADVKTRGLMIGRNAQKLRNLERIVQRFFDIKEIRVKNPDGS